MNHPADPWPAPRPDGPVRGTVRVPGSKSLTNRYLVLAALAEGPSRLRGVLDSRDSRLMIQALTALGASISRVAPGTVEVIPVPDAGPRTPADGVTIDCGLAGTVMRFVPPVAGLALGPTSFDADTSARGRPMRTMIEATRQSFRADVRYLFGSYLADERNDAWRNYLFLGASATAS